MRSLTHSSAGTPAATLSTLSISERQTLTSTILPSHFQPISSLAAAMIPGHNSPTTASTRHSFFTISDCSPLLSTHAKGYVNQAIQNSWTKTTINRYSSAIRLFIQFCDSEGIPERFRFPADEFVLCAFAASSIGKYGSSTSRARLSALKAWHITHNIEWKGSPRLRYVLNGVHNIAPKSSKRPLRPPINVRMLAELVSTLDLDSPFDSAVAACATVAFWGQCRLGELLPSSSASFLPTLLPTRSDFKRSLRNPQSCLLHLPCTKTHRQGQDIVLVEQRFPVNPIFLLKNHLRVSNISSNQTLFSYTSATGYTVLTKPSFLQRCNGVWQRLGYPHTTGHCFCIGGTTELLVAGTPPEVVKATGRWSSESFLRYWRSLDDIAPQYIQNLPLHPQRHRRRTTTAIGG